MGLPMYNWTYSSFPVVQSGTITSTIARVTALHDCVDNLRFEVVAPSSSSCTLTYHYGEDGDDYLGTIFSDLSPIGIWEGSPPYAGVYYPYDSLSVFNGQQLSGDWEFQIYNGYYWCYFNGTWIDAELAFCVTP
jgi:hypothetical protein